MIACLRQGLKEDGFEVLINQLGRWFEMPRRTVYYKPTNATPKVKPELAEPIKALTDP